MEDKRIKKEKARLNKIYKDIGQSKMALVEGLIERAAFMRVQLEDMEAELLKNGWVDMFRQGDAPAYERARPIANNYTQTNNSYQKLIKQLNDLLPDSKTETVTAAGNALASFVIKGK